MDPFLIVLLWTALKDMWEDIRGGHDDDAEYVRLRWRYDFCVKEFVEATRVLCVSLSCSGGIFLRSVSILNVCRGPCGVCAPVPVCSERPETPQNPVLSNARAPLELFLRSMIFSEWKFLKFGRSTEQNTGRV